MSRALSVAAFCLLWSGVADAFTVEDQPLVFTGGVYASAGDRVGHSVATSTGGPLKFAVGAPLAAVGGLAEAGEAYVSSSTAVRYGYITNPAPGAGHRFGRSVAMTTEGADDWLFVGAPGDGFGKVYVYTLDPNALIAIDRYVLHSTIVPNNIGPVISHADFGHSMSVKGGLLAVGDPKATVSGDEQGVVRLFEYDGPTDSWVDIVVLGQGAVATVGGRFGHSVAVGEVLDGTLRVAIGGPRVQQPQSTKRRGKVTVFEDSNGLGNWIPEHSLIGAADDRWFGDDVAMDADLLVVGSRGLHDNAQSPAEVAAGTCNTHPVRRISGRASVFRHDPLNFIQEWGLEIELVPGEMHGGMSDTTRMRVDISENRVIIGERVVSCVELLPLTYNGAVHTFVYNSILADWIDESELTDAFNNVDSVEFGSDVALTRSNLAFVGGSDFANGEGAGFRYALQPVP